MGISARDYPTEVEAMWGMSKEDARKIASRIYKRDYWDAIGGDALPSPLDLAAFDSCVNVGVGKANSWLKETGDPVSFLFLRLEHYAKLQNFNAFGRGWVNRVAALYKEITKG